jgi:methylmalonyl-CoA mutase
MTAPDQQAGALLEAWRKLAAPETGDITHLRSATLEGIPVEPLYPSATAPEPLAGRGARPWTIVEIVDQDRPEEAHEAAAAALKDGATGLALRFAPGSSGPGLQWSPETLVTVLDRLDLDGVTLRLEPHALSGEIAGGLAARMAQNSDMAAADISFGLNPVALAVSGATHAGKAFAAAWRTLAEARLLALVAEVDGRPYHEAGGGEALELAAILAEAAFALRALDAAGIAPETALDAIGASVAVDHDQFLSIAKLRALRLLFARLREVIGAPPKALRIHAETSRRMLTARDPHNNLVRATIAAFGAGAGGADSIAVAPYDAAQGLASSAARRLARNTQHLLLEEAHIARVADPGCGSGAVEALTASLCERAWALFQTIEVDGGVLASLADGTLARELAAGRAALADAASAGRLPIVGVSVYAADSAPSPAPEAEPPIHTALAPMRLEAAFVP